jgi:C4-dicarboxylate-specific signal transduction histidine kinase
MIAVTATDGRTRSLARLAARYEIPDAVIDIEDCGVGKSAEVLANLRCFGFTTKPGGHGFALQYCANAAREIGAIIAAHGEGPVHGSRSIIRLVRETPRAGGV